MDDVQMVILSPLDPMVDRVGKRWSSQPAKHSAKGIHFLKEINNTVTLFT